MCVFTSVVAQWTYRWIRAGAATAAVTTRVSTTGDASDASVAPDGDWPPTSDRASVRTRCSEQNIAYSKVNESATLNGTCTLNR